MAFETPNITSSDLVDAGETVQIWQRVHRHIREEVDVQLYDLDQEPLQDPFLDDLLENIFGQLDTLPGVLGGAAEEAAASEASRSVLQAPKAHGQSWAHEP